MTPTGSMIKVLGTVSLVCGVLIVATNLVTQPRTYGQRRNTDYSLFGGSKAKAQTEVCGTEVRQ